MAINGIMIDSIFDKKFYKKIDSIAREKAKTQEKECNAYQEFMKITTPDTMSDVFNIIDKFGHPKEQELAKQIKNKYDSNEDLSVEDMLSLDVLYRSCYNHMNKGDCDE